MADRDTTTNFHLLNLSVSLDADRRRLIAIALGIFLFTFFAYYITGPDFDLRRLDVQNEGTPYGHQVNQANNILHGHLDFVPEHTRNLGTLERVMYDGKGFCFQPGDPAAWRVPNARFSPDCKIYMQHSLGPALMVIPGILVWGNGLNQVLVSIIFGAMTAPVVFLISRHLSARLRNQLLMTALMMFGTIFWWVASNGGVWFFAHTTATFFIFCAIFFTIGRPNPFLAGAFLGAAFLCRPTTILTGLFFVVMFSPLWLMPPEEGKAFWQRINLQPAINFVSGLAPMLFLGMSLNYMRFDDPLETGYGYTEQMHQAELQFVYPHGLFDISYVERHPPVLLGQMPLFQDSGPYILPSWAGMAIWATTPPFFYAFFTTFKKFLWVMVGGGALLGLAALFILSKAVARAWDGSWATTDVPLGLEYAPFWLMTIAAAGAALYFRDRFSAACWAAIIPTTFFIFTFAATGWAQFGFRYGLDFTPFLWLLVAKSIGDDFRWHHLALMGVAFLVNLMGVLWVYQFDPDHLNGWTWVRF
ncbi:MAG TPA: hypothetical protein VFO71_14090 [Gemmatimonadales bacterium]|nr:hypothetical protein [Gemmatimonadales bacterium]